MNRRDLIKIILGSAIAATSWTPAAQAQQRQRVPKIGVLWHAGSRDEEGTYFPALIQGFKDLGYDEAGP
jgi:hypothetical protein